MKDLLDYSDYSSVRDNILDTVKESVGSSFPLANDRFGLKVSNLRYVGKNGYSKDDQKKAILENRSLTRRLVGDWQSYDSVSGKSLGDARTTTVMNVPWLTDRGTFIRKGVEYVGLKQLRLDPNVYTRTTEDGKVESQFNVKPRTGSSFRLFMDPATSHFFMKHRGRKVPLYPVLKAMGMKDEQMEKTWGKQIMEANRTLQRSPYAVNWLKQYGAVQQQKQASIPQETPMRSQDILKHNLLSEFTKSELDPDNTFSTLGQRYDRVTPEAMLTSTGKILGVSRGTMQPDDRDSLEFQQVYDFSDFMKDSITNDQNGHMRQLLWKLTGAQGNMDKIQPSYMDRYVNHLFETNLVQAPEEISPIDIYDQNQRVTRLGPGALPSLDVVPKEARSVQPSYLGFIDPVRAPECYVAGMEVYTDQGWVKWPEVTADTQLACRIDKVLEFHKPVRVMNYYVNEDVYCYDDPDIAYAVTHNHRMWAGANRTSGSFEFTEARSLHMQETFINKSLDGWRSTQLVPPGYTTSRYTGNVYCAEVPGGILYVRTPGKSGFWCGNSLKIGVDLKFARNVRKGKDNRLYTEMMNARSGKKEWVSSRDAARSTVAFPHMLKTKDQYVPGIDGRGITGYVDRKDVDFIIERGGDMFSTNANMVPSINGIKGMRLLMGCLASDTNILIKRTDGSWFYDQVCKYVHTEGDQTLSLNKDGSEVWRDVRAVIPNTKKVGRLAVTLKSGRTLITTDNHKWTTQDYYGNLIEMRADRLRVGMPIPRACGFKLPEDTISKVHIPGRTSPQATSPRVPTDIALDASFGWFCGMYLAEGCVEGKKKCSIDIACDNEILQERLISIINSWNVPAKVSLDGGDSGHVVLGWTSMGEWLTSTDNFSRLSRHKRVPGWVFAAPEEFRKGLLQGYVDGDGWFSKRRKYLRMGAGTRSKDLAEGMMLLMSQLGIDTTVSTDYPLDEPFYNIGIRSEHIHKMPRPYQPHRRTMYDTVDHWSGKKSCQWVPIVGPLHEMVLKVSSRKSQFRHRSYVDQHTKHSLQEHISADKWPWIASNVLWDKIKTIEPIDPEETTYDLDLDDNTFITGTGIYVHNSKHLNSAVPLVKRQGALVRTAGMVESNESEMSKFVGALRTNKPGVVKQVRKDGIIVSNTDGTESTYEMYNNFPFARKTFLRNTPRVKAGDQVDENSLLASSNFTDDKGDFAGGTNLRTAYLNAHGYNFEDGVVMSESGARKLTSEHMYKERIQESDDLVMDKKKYQTLFPAKFDKDQWSTLDDSGMVKPGTLLKYGDPMFVAYKHVPPTEGTAGRRVNQEAAQVWKHPYPAVVTDASRGQKGWQVLVRSNQPMQVGDKLSGRHGNKGVVARIVPDAQMFRDEHGDPLDLILNANGIPSRTNSAQAMEMALAKVAQKTGQTITVDAFDDESLPDKSKKLLAANGLKDRETVFDPITGKKIPKIYTGPMYIYKQQHTAEGKGKARATGNYTAEGTPARGGKTGAKHFGRMEQAALLAHGAEGLIKDLKLVKGQKNDNFWRDMKAGRTPTIPDSPYVYDKFRNMLKASGINLREEKDADHIFAMTNDNVMNLTGDRRLHSSGTFKADGMKPVEGGLFDPKIAGQKGNMWGYIELPEPILNPIAEDVVRSLLGVRKKDLESMLVGEADHKGKSGGEALRGILSGLSLKKIKADAAKTIKEGAKSKRDAAIKRYSYANALIKQGTTADQLMWDRVPVLPPQFRPITNMNGMTMVADPNYLYKATLDSVKDFKDASEASLGKDGMTEARRAVLNNVRALIGTADPVQDKLKQKNIKGILQQVVGKGSPKNSLVQRRVIGTNIDVSGLAVITPNPSLKMDQVGLPEKQAWELYEPYIQRELVRRGYGATQASEMVEKHNPAAYNALQKVVKDRPIMYNRAPTLHKYSIMGAWPVLTKGTSLQIHPAVVGPFNADFDGDTMSFAVPTTEDATRDIINKMMPQKLLLSERDDKPNFVPSNEYVQGLWLATKRARRTSVKRFDTLADAKRAYAKGKIQVDDPIEILDKQ